MPEFIRQFKRVLATVLLSGAATAAFAGNSADIRVTGTITPGSCSIDVGNNGLFDLGKIPASSLNRGANTTLPGVSASFNVSCDAPLRFVLQAIDNRADSVFLIGGANVNFGVGFTPANEKIGDFYALFKGLSADGQPVGVTLSGDGGRTWNGADYTGSNALSTGKLQGFTVAPGGATSGPSAIQNLSGTFLVTGRIQDADNLTLTQEVSIDGSATIELVYL
ncbi:DUF1120 domain-containing protein [Dyella sp. Tek66A03]|uniref:DUF1120 domain-containing protein n=1 Tax=Dyella sp. Tek66A03 TaxID=3458298 RepID=UPI00403E93DA